MSEPTDGLAAQPCLPTAPDADVVNPDAGAAPVLLTRVDPSCNMRRFYGLERATSLFGECGVVRYWGRMGTRGRSRTDWYDEAPEAERALEALLRAKEKRGYSP